MPAGAPASAPPLYFRVLRSPPASIRVELWELGKPEGVRNVSGTGTPAFEARRVALAAAELARTFRERRVAELAAFRAEEKRAEAAAAHGDGVPIYARLAWAAGVRAALASSAQLVGPRAEASLRFQSGPRLALDASWLAGRGTAPEHTRSLRFLEVGLAASDGVLLSSQTTLDVGLHAALDSVRVGGSGISPPTDTWSARAGLFVRAEVKLGKTLSLGAGPEASVLLRRVDPDIHGLFLGATVSLIATP